MCEGCAVKKTIAITVSLILFGAGVACLVQRSRPRELVYQGEGISAWAFQLYGPIRREEAAVVFKEVGEEAVPDLIRMLRAKDPMLAKVLYPPPTWLPRPLQQFIRRTIRPADTSARRLVAAHAVAALGRKAATAVPALGGLLTGGNLDERWIAATALGRVATPEALQICVDALRGKNLELHHAAVYALGEMGTNASAALPEVLACLRHQHEVVRDSAGYTLSQIGKPALEPLLERVRSSHGIERRAAAAALTRLWPSPRVVLPPLVQMLEDPEPKSRLQALQALLTIAPWHEDVVAALTNLNQDADEDIRTVAAEALARHSERPGTQHPL